MRIKYVREEEDLDVFQVRACVVQSVVDLQGRLDGVFMRGGCDLEFLRQVVNGGCS